MLFVYLSGKNGLPVGWLGQVGELVAKEEVGEPLVQRPPLKFAFSATTKCIWQAKKGALSTLEIRGHPVTNYNFCLT
jgi:hypothetical protein